MDGGGNGATTVRAVALAPRSREGEGGSQRRVACLRTPGARGSEPQGERGQVTRSPCPPADEAVIVNGRVIRRAGKDVIGDGETLPGRVLHGGTSYSPPALPAR